MPDLRYGATALPPRHCSQAPPKLVEAKAQGSSANHLRRLWYAGILKMPDPSTPEPSTPARATSSQLAKSAGVIGAATMTSRVLGLVRDQVMAFLFGAGDQMDAYNIAFRIPTWCATCSPKGP